jgi:hypothetical protein
MTTKAVASSSAQGHRPGDWNPDDFDVVDEGFDVPDDGRTVGRIYRISAAS